jgi:phospholipid/cholesterol/gamma-HCH transport system permease protein
VTRRDVLARAGSLLLSVLAASGRATVVAVSMLYRTVRTADYAGFADFLASVGRVFLGFLAGSGRLALFTVTAISHCFRPPFYPRLLARQMVDIGYYSLPVVGLTAVFTGMVLALQTNTGFSRFAAEGAVATVVVLSMTRELGPVIAGLMVAGRIGAAIAAEIGTMRVTDQIDALVTLSTNPFKYLVVPRVLAGALTLPMLVLVSDIVGVFGGFLVATYKLHFNESSYIGQTADYLRTEDVVSGLVKASVFGFIVTLMGCYHGYHSRGGAQGVGAATTYAVVSASIMILLFDYVLTALFFAE